MFRHVSTESDEDLAIPISEDILEFERTMYLPMNGLISYFKVSSLSEHRCLTHCKCCRTFLDELVSDSVKYISSQAGLGQDHVLSLVLTILSFMYQNHNVYLK